jgi:hypothetical protein
MPTYEEDITKDFSESMGGIRQTSDAAEEVKK